MSKTPKTVSELLEPYEKLLDKLPDEKPLKAKLIDTPLGPMFAVSNEKAVVFLIFTESRHFDREFKNFIKIHANGIIEEDVKPLLTAESEIKEYFSGKLTEFDTPYEIDKGTTDFQRQVWEKVNEISYGETTTFADLARAVGKPSGAQPVANACGRNPISLIVPSHRVLSSNQSARASDPNNTCIIRREWLLSHEKKYAQEKK